MALLADAAAVAAAPVIFLEISGVMWPLCCSCSSDSYRLAGKWCT